MQAMLPLTLLDALAAGEVAERDAGHDIGSVPQSLLQREHYHLLNAHGCAQWY
jgi:hypothetical protein